MSLDKVIFDKNLIGQRLEDYNSLFRLFWDYGNIEFDISHQTAWIEFDPKGGDFISFKFNPKFWNSISDYMKEFVICHELLHIFLNHSKRGIEFPKQERFLVNQAQDIVVNHLLIDRFGFEKDKIDNWKDYCWVDTCFNDISIPFDRSFEYYLDLLKQNNESPKHNTIDEHVELDDSAIKNIKSYIESFSNSLTKEDVRQMNNLDSKELDNSLVNNLAGNECGHWGKVNAGKGKVKRKWESIVKKWEQKYLSIDDTSHERWDRINRRYNHILRERNAFLPTECIVEDSTFKEKKITVFFFLDSSGSCAHLADRFFTAARSLDKRKFNIRLFCFDTDVIEIDIKKNKIYGFGGTAFNIIENKIQLLMKQENIKYPSAVWIITDGWGNRVTPKHPERWNWFLTNDFKDYIPKKSNIFMLKDFE